jgi:alpha-D-xyloside xylohydrolase
MKDYRDKDIPCDLIHIDSGWVDKGSDYEGHGICYGNNPKGYCDFKWDSRQFPDPQKMISEISRQGFKFSLWETALVNPNVGEFYEHGKQQEYFLKNPDGSVCLVPYGTRGPVAIPDFTNPKTPLWWKQQHKPLVDIGVDAFKLDISGDLRTAENAVFHDGRTLDQGRILHRILNLKTAFEAVADYTNARGIIYSSIATAGTQRYPIHWSGDYKLTFDAVAEMVKNAQNMGLSGFGYYSPDIPGARGIKDPKLYTRWAQFGLLNAICQNWYVLPWDLGADAEDNFRVHAKLHYRLLPYIYSYARIANQTGVPIVRAMVIECQNDPQVYDKDLQYFLGGEFLIAPICSESDARQIYLPAGKWFDYATRRKYEGPKNITYQVPLERIPIFVKAGAIIPMAPVMNYVDEKPSDPLTLDIYPCGTSSFTLYEDDGKTYDYRNGVFALTTFVCAQAEDGILVDIGPRRGKYEENADKAYILKINGVSHPAEILIGGESIKECASLKDLEVASAGWFYDSAKQIVFVKVGTVIAGEGQKIFLKGAETTL